METLLTRFLIILFTFLGGYIIGQRYDKFSLDQQYDEDDETENDKELEEREES